MTDPSADTSASPLTASLTTSTPATTSSSPPASNTTLLALEPSHMLLTVHLTNP